MWIHCTLCNGSAVIEMRFEHVSRRTPWPYYACHCSRAADWRPHLNIAALVSEAADLTVFVVSLMDWFVVLGCKICRLVSTSCFDRIPQEMGLLTWDIGRRSFGSYWGRGCKLVPERETVMLGKLRNVSVYVHVCLANGRCCKCWIHNHTSTRNVPAFFLCHSIDTWMMWLQNQLHKVLCKIHIPYLSFVLSFIVALN